MPKTHLIINLWIVTSEIFIARLTRIYQSLENIGNIPWTIFHHKDEENTEQSKIKRYYTVSKKLLRLIWEYVGEGSDLFYFQQPRSITPGRKRPFLPYLTRFISTVLWPLFVVGYTVSNCSKRPENRVSDRLRSFTVRWNTVVIWSIWNESNTSRKLPKTTVCDTVFDGYGGRKYCRGKTSKYCIERK